MKKVKRSFFGKSIDERCPGYTLLEKFMVWAGILADAKESEIYARIDQELRIKEGRY